MYHGKKKSAEDIVRDLSDEQIDRRLKRTLAAVQRGEAAESPGLIRQSQFVIAWASLRAANFLKRRCPNAELIGGEIGELFFETRFKKGLSGFDWNRKLTAYCARGIGRMCISRGRTEGNHRQLERKRALMQARANRFRKKAEKSRLERAEDVEALRRAMSELPNLERTAVTLRHWHRVSSAVGAEELGITPEQFTKAVCKGLKLLRAILGDDFMDEAA